MLEAAAFEVRFKLPMDMSRQTFALRLQLLNQGGVGSRVGTSQGQGAGPGIGLAREYALYRGLQVGQGLAAAAAAAGLGADAQVLGGESNGHRQGLDFCGLTAAQGLEAQSQLSVQWQVFEQGAALAGVCGPLW